MDYFKVGISNLKEGDSEILMACLSELGCESFLESNGELEGFIPFDLFNKPELISFLDKEMKDKGIVYTLELIGEQNWNAIWESQYEPVTIAGKCLVRAPFHQAVPGIKYDLIIEPRMSFGTAHHETTALMIEMLMEEEPEGRKVLDMGCGTGVLAILASEMGALSVDAIDVDDWAFENAQDNCRKNNAGVVTVIKGGRDAIPGSDYNVIIANINRNVLLEDIPAYAGRLAANGILLMSGFYVEDIPVIIEKALESGLNMVNHREQNRWVGIKFIK